MQKVIELIPAAGIADPGGWYLANIAPTVLASTGLVALTVNVADARPAGAPASPPYALVTELWYPALEAYEASAIWRSHEGLAALVAYDVSERVQKDHVRTWPPGSPSPGVKAIYLVRRRDELSDAQARQRWSSHADIAREHHAGMSRYVQNGVRRALTPGAPLRHGIAMLHFPTLEDLEMRMYDSEEGRRVVQQDVDGLVAESIPLFTTEHILKAAP